MNELEQSFPLQRSFTEGTIKDFLGNFIPENRLADIRHIEVFEGSENHDKLRLGSAYRFKLTDSKGETTIFTVDMDDTLVQYTLAKEKFHQAVIDQYLTGLTFPDEILSGILIHINKSARILPHDGLHPEIYNPTLEILAITQFITRYHQGDFGPQGEGLTKIWQKAGGDKKVINEWVRVNLLKPIITGEQALFPAPILQTETKNDKTYFREVDDLTEFLATAINDSEAILLSDQLGLDSGRAKLFQGLYQIFQDYMFEPEINQAVVPQESDGGRFVIATFGEARFQLIKVKRLLERLTALGLRLPDEILFFDAGRKAPVIEHLARDKANLGIKIIHLDNSANQCHELEDTKENIHAVLFVPKTDRETNFSQLINPNN